MTSTNPQHGSPSPLHSAHAHVEEEFLHSADGTRIGYRRLGQGPSIVFVHGSVSTHTDWMPAAKILSARFTCLVMDRRGRRGSGAGHGAYQIEQEYEDVCALLEVAGQDSGGRGSAGREPMLAGHSFGAICAMGAALMRPVAKLALYEPPISVNGPVAPAAALAAYAAAVEAGENERAMEIGLTHFTRLAPEVIASMKTTKGWPKLCNLAPTWTRELEAMNACTSAETCAGLGCPVLLLVGERSLEHPYHDSARALTAALEGALKNVRVETILGQDHMALRGAPERVARLLEEFFGGGRATGWRHGSGP